MNKKLQLVCWGGVGSVTGANFLLEDEHTRIAVDCGLLQGDPNAGGGIRKRYGVRTGCRRGHSQPLRVLAQQRDDGVLLGVGRVGRPAGGRRGVVVWGGGE